MPRRYPEIVAYNEAVQNPGSAFRDPELRQGRMRSTRSACRSRCPAASR